LGKTTLWHELKKLRKDVDIFIDYLSEDKLWEKLMLQQRIQSPNLTEGELFLAIKDQGNAQYWEELKLKMKAFAETRQQNIIFFLDKIIYPETLDLIL